jgi:mxaJ protein
MPRLSTFGLVVALTLSPPLAAAGDPDAGTLRVCADPNNLPFSNARGEGFENEIAGIVAKELGVRLAYEWKPQRRGFLRTGLNAGACDVVIGVPTELDMALTTRPYYRSSYAFLWQRSARRRIVSLDDPALKQLRIGVQLIGDDYANSPPSHALARRGLATNLVGFTVYGDYGQESPLADIVRAVERGTIDVAVAWGPLAGYFAKRSAVPLEVHAVRPSRGDGDLPMSFDISMAVAKGRRELKAQLDRVIASRRGDIRAVLARFGVPHE